MTSHSVTEDTVYLSAGAYAPGYLWGLYIGVDLLYHNVCILSALQSKKKAFPTDHFILLSTVCKSTHNQMYLIDQ